MRISGLSLADSRRAAFRVKGVAKGAAAAVAVAEGAEGPRKRFSAGAVMPLARMEGADNETPGSAAR